MRSLHEECGVFGVIGDLEASQLTYLGLYALQHRGQEACGIAVQSSHAHRLHRGLGLVGDVFNAEVLDQLAGVSAIGHVRYSTAGENHVRNAQPLVAELKWGPVAVAHNGNLVNASELRAQLVAGGAIFQGSSDTEIILHLLALSSETDFGKALEATLKKMEGAFSLLVMTRDAVFAVRDALGFRPLSYGSRRTAHGDSAWVVSSETCAFDLIGAEFIGDINAGEWCEFRAGSDIRKVQWADTNSRQHQCVFEHIYFARPDSVVFGQHVHSMRKLFGQELAREDQAVSADLVIPVPDSGVPAAMGYAEASGIKFEMGIIRNHYIGRTFIEPTPSIRSFGVKIKLNPQTALLKGRSVVVVDDSLVRGTTSQKIISLLRERGASRVHFRIACPPTISPCYYGVDTPDRDQLIAAHKSNTEICQFIGADSLRYLSREGLLKVVQDVSSQSYCVSCFTGNYPTRLPKTSAKQSMLGAEQ